jgi:hypothetical protein
MRKYNGGMARVLRGVVDRVAEHGEFFCRHLGYVHQRIASLEAKVKALENRWAGQNPRTMTPEEYAVYQRWAATNIANVCQKADEPTPAPKQEKEQAPWRIAISDEPEPCPTCGQAVYRITFKDTPAPDDLGKDEGG